VEKADMLERTGTPNLSFTNEVSSERQSRAKLPKASESNSALTWKRPFWTD
jgi:hypothetical protein